MSSLTTSMRKENQVKVLGSYAGYKSVVSYFCFPTVSRNHSANVTKVVVCADVSYLSGNVNTQGSRRLHPAELLSVIFCTCFGIG